MHYNNFTAPFNTTNKKNKTRRILPFWLLLKYFPALYLKVRASALSGECVLLHEIYRGKFISYTNFFKDPLLSEK